MHLVEKCAWNVQLINYIHKLMGGKNIEPTAVSFISLSLLFSADLQGNCKWNKIIWKMAW